MAQRSYGLEYNFERLVYVILDQVYIYIKAPVKARVNASSSRSSDPIQRF